MESREEEGWPGPVETCCDCLPESLQRNRKVCGVFIDSECVRVDESKKVTGGVAMC